MMKAPLPEDESLRLNALYQYQILDTLPEEAFDDLTRLAAHICGTPITLVSLLDANRQWFKSKVGLAVSETSRDLAFCAYAILQPELLIVPDAKEDKRFADNPLVTEDPKIRFYAGAPLINPSGFSLGTLCVIDYVPRTLSPSQQDALKTLARQVMAQLELRRNLAALAETVTQCMQAEAVLRLNERAMAATSNGIVITNADRPENPIIYCNPAFEKITGYSSDEVLGRNCRFLQGNDTDPAAIAQIRQALREEQECRVILKNYRKDGTPFWNELAISPVKDVNGRLTHYIGVQSDITERRKTEDALLRAKMAEAVRKSLEAEIAERKHVEKVLRESQRKLNTLIDSLPGIVFSSVKDSQWSMRYLSEGCLNLTGYTSQELVSDRAISYYSLAHPEDLPKILETIDRAIASKQAYIVEYRIRTQSGQEKWVWEKGRGVFGSNDELISLEGFIIDITERKQAEEIILHNALHDPLTGLPNRTLLIDRLEHALHAVQRNSQLMFAVLFLDLDRFKVVNDSLGHAAGDRLLIAVAQKLKAQLRLGDTVARLGGDEFVILLENLLDLKDATRTADRIQQALSCPFNLNGHEVFTSASIGIALSNEFDKQPESFLRNADIAMYRAKSSGKARHAIFSLDMHEQAWSRLRLENDLRRAIERQELTLYYQPIVKLETGRIVSFETLVRWQHPEQGLLSPAAFISVAEETGLIVPLGQWVLHYACQQLKQWQTQFSIDSSFSAEILPLTISVNISARQFGQPNSLEQIQKVLFETGLEAKNLKLEITESVLMDNAQMATTLLLQLKELGIQLHIDDFGTGYSSLSYLHQFPVDALKIDRSFISRMGINERSDSEGISIVHTIVTLARNLKVDVIAEGIETTGQLAQLKKLNCLYGQGYFFSRPLDRKAATKLIEREFLRSLN